MQRITFPAKLAYESFVASPGPFFKASDYPDLTGKKWVVTGATGGIGLEVSRVLVSLGAEVWLVGRNTVKLEQAREKLLKFSKGAPIHTLVMDFTDLTTIRPSVQQLKQETSTLDGIVHNAGVMNVPPGSKTKQDIELTVGVNNVASQLLQNLLDPLIENNPHGRLVWLSSVAHAMAPRNGFDLRVLATGAPEKIYAMSKAWSYVQAVQWSVHHPQSPVKAIAVHPGVVRTDLARTTTASYIKFLFNLFGQPVEMGALAPLYAALYPDIKNNDYVIPFGRSGVVRPDILQSAKADEGAAVITWLNEKAASY